MYVFIKELKRGQELRPQRRNAKFYTKNNRKDYIYF